MQEKPTPTEAEWAWLAGLFEGEGTFNFHSKHSVAATIKMTDRDVLETVHRLAPAVGGVRSINRRSGASPHHKPQYEWSLGARDEVIWFIEGILPLLHSRRESRAREALTRLETNRGLSSGKKHCRHGHVWAEVGVYTSPGGKRHCKACVRESCVRYREKHREQYLKAHREREQKRRAKRRVAA